MASGGANAAGCPLLLTIGRRKAAPGAVQRQARGLAWRTSTGRLGFPQSPVILGSFTRTNTITPDRTNTITRGPKRPDKHHHHVQVVRDQVVRTDKYVQAYGLCIPSAFRLKNGPT